MVDVKMKFNSMEEMRKEFTAAEKQLDESMREMKKVAKMMEDGALVGDGGTEMVQAINGKLLPRMTALHAKMGELAKDIDGAVRATRDGERTAQSRFK